jgi:uncharacterized protein
VPEPEKPVTLAIISDTHVDRLDQLPATVLKAMADADLIIHLGDFDSPRLIDDLEKSGKFRGIWGNHDRLPEMRRRLKRMEIIEIGGKRVGLIHGLFYPVGLHRRLKAWFKQDNLDILLFGHSHVATIKKLGKVLLFNPGSVTAKFPAAFGSFGIMTLNGAVKSQIIPVQNNISLKTRILTAIPAWIIREGTSFLESWPYIDFSFLWNWSGKIRSRFSGHPGKIHSR